MRALGRKVVGLSKRVKEALEKDPGEIFDKALDILRKEDPEAFEDRLNGGLVKTTVKDKVLEVPAVGVTLSP